MLKATNRSLVKFGAIRLFFFPQKFCAIFQRVDPERDLWFAVLQVALQDAGFRRDGRLLASTADSSAKHTACAWLLSFDSSICSFRWVCQTLGLDSSYLRGRVFSLPARHTRANIKTVRPMSEMGGRRCREPSSCDAPALPVNRGGRDVTPLERSAISG